MAKARFTLALVLLFVWTATPALRCLIPGEVITAEEQACCKSMGGQCGDSPTSDHPCCKRVTSTPQPALAASQAALSAPVLAAASIPLVANSIVEQRFVPTWLIDPSPPHRSQAGSVLRI
jgi:hypothetical protein